MRRIPRVSSDPLCVTFNRLSESIWDDLASARSLGIVRDEETVTNNFLLDAQINHRDQISVIQFHKIQESKVGADWEWWFTDDRRRSWVGMLVQAKILNPLTNKYTQIKHHVDGRLQIEILLATAQSKGISAFYFFYNHTNLTGLPWKCQGADYQAKQLGCTVAHAGAVKNLLGSGGAGIMRMGQISLPLRCLVCCKESSGYADTLPERAIGAIGNLPKGDVTTTEEDFVPSVRPEPPDYVNEIMRAPAEDRARTIDRVRRKIGSVRNLAIITQNRSRVPYSEPYP